MPSTSKTALSRKNIASLVGQNGETLTVNIPILAGLPIRKIPEHELNVAQFTRLKSYARKMGFESTLRAPPGTSPRTILFTLSKELPNGEYSQKEAAAIAKFVHNVINIRIPHNINHPELRRFIREGIKIQNFKKLQQ